MRRSLPAARRPVARLSRVAAVAAVAALALGGMQAPAWAANGVVTITGTNGSPGAAASNTAAASVTLQTTSQFVFNAATNTGVTVTFTRTGTAGPAPDQITGTVTAGSLTPGPLPPGVANTFTVTVDLTSANPGTYDVTVSGATTGSPTQVDACSACYTALSSAPTVTSITPTQIARNGAATLTVLGAHFAKGNYPGTNSNYACPSSSCTNPPKLEVRVHGALVPDPGITLSDPTSGSTTTPIAATSTSMGKRIAVGASATLGAHDIYVENTDGASFTLANALTVDPAMTISSVVPATRGQNSSGGTLTITGTDFPTDVQGSITIASGLGNTNGLHYAFVRDSATQVRFTSFGVDANATLGARTIVLTSPSEFQTLTSGAFSVTAAPTPSTEAAPDSTINAYGRGATAVHVVVNGSGFTPGSGASGAQILFAPSTGITVESQSSTATAVTATVDIGGAAATGLVTLSVQNNDGGVASCSSACTFTVDPAPQITGVAPGSEARDQTTTVALTGTNLADATKKAAPTVTFTHALVGGTSAASGTSASVTGVHADAAFVGAQDIHLVNNDDKGQTTCVGCFTSTSLAVTGTTSGSALNDHTVSAIATGNGFDPTATVRLVKTGTGSATVPAITGTVTTPPSESAPGKADGTSLTASFPLAGVDPGSYAFEVTNPNGTPFPGVGQGGLYTVVANAPTIASVSPSSRGAGAVNQSVVLSGTNFGPHATVTFSNAAVHVDSVTRDSATQITVVVHIDADVVADPSGTVKVTNTDNQSKTATFGIVTGPHINHVSPGSRGQGAADTTVTVTGTQGTFPTAAHTSLTFTGGTGVTATGFTATPGSPGTPPAVPATDDTLTGTLSVTSGATVGAYDVVLVDTSTGGRSVCTGCFTVHVKPTLTSVTPGSGAVGTAVPVTLAGTGFLTGPTVTAVDGLTTIAVSNVVEVSSSSITATFTIPAGTAPDTFADVTVTNTDGGSAALSSAFHVFGKPGAPTIGTATPGNGKATVTWTAPASDGGSALTSYTVTASPGGLTATVAAPATTTDVTGLTNGTPYTFVVHATNAAGSGADSAASNAATPRTVPGQPTGVTATANDASAVVSWTAPVDNGGAAISGYTVTSSPGGLTASVGPAERSAAVTGLTNGTPYTFTVHATNVAGDGAESDPSSPAVTPVGVPTAPSQVQATPGDGQATVTWTAPVDNGGSAIVSYTVTSTPDGVTKTVPASSTTAAVTGLTNGTPYTFTVHATNSTTDSLESAASNAVTPRTVPDAPTGVKASPGDGLANVSWTAPTVDGGSAVLSYTVTASPGGASNTVNAPATTAPVGGLTNGTAYTFTVVATNAAGDSLASDPSTAVTPAAKPGKPTIGTATAGDASATVTWTAPASDGGSAILTYRVTASPGGASATVSAPATSATVSGLANGTPYTFTVHATNGVGDGPESDPSNAVTPATLPGAPTGVNATSGNQQAIVSWTKPADDGGATVTSYTVVVSPSGPTVPPITGNPAPTTTTVTGLTNGTAYTFTVKATNSVGTGPTSSPSTAVTPSTTPTAPQSVSAVAGDRAVRVNWTAPAADGGAPVTGYLVSLNGGAAQTVGASVRTLLLTGLTNGTSYSATVEAQNLRGPSTPTGAAPVTPKFLVTGTIARSTSTITYGGAVTISGRFTRSNGSALAGRTVRIYAKTYPATTYHITAQLTTGSNGQWSLVSRPTRVTTYYASFSGDTADVAKNTAGLSVAVRFKITVTSPKNGATVRAGTVVVHASELPRTPGTLGYLVMRRSNGSVVTLVRATVDSKGNLTLSRRFTRGTYVLAVQLASYKGCTTNRTAFFTLKVV